MFTPLWSQLHAQWAHKCLAAHTLFNTRVACTPLLYNHGDSPLCAERRIYMQLSALQNLCEKQRTDLITCWQGAKQVISKHGDVCRTASADRDSFAISEISLVFCSQHIYATLFTVSTVSWSSAVWICGGNQVAELWNISMQSPTSANIKAQELMLEQIYPLKSAYMFTGDICWGLLVKSCVRSGILSSVNTS